MLAGFLGTALLFLAGAVRAQPPGSIPPIYTQRLRMPVRGDDFAQPRAVVADLNTGEVFVADLLRNRIVIFDEKGRFRYEIPGGSSFQSPVDLAVDPDGYLFVVSQVSAEITLLDFDGRFIERLTLTGLPPDIESPRFSSLAISPGGDSLYLLDPENDRLWIADRDGATRGSVDMRVGRSQEEIDQLRYGHVDVYGDTVLLAVSSDGLVHLFDLEGRARKTLGDQGSAECQTRLPAAAALDGEGRAIILDQQRALFMTWDVERGACLSEHYGFGNAPGAFYQPSDLALDAAGRLYVSQGFEGRVQVYEGAEPAPEPPVDEEPIITATLEQATDEPVAEPAREGESAGAGEEASTDATTAVPLAVESPELGTLVAAGARLSVERAPRYDPSYVEIAYPGGDPPLDRGAAVDVVVRAFRHAGVDLQRALHEDLVEAAEAYAIQEPDPNIDHRRIRNLVTFFQRRATSLSVAPDGDWAPGDVVFWDRNVDGVAGHLGVVTAETGPSGEPLVVHHPRPEGEFAGYPSVDDVLFRWPVVSHYRWSQKPEDEGVRLAPASTPTAVRPPTPELPEEPEAPLSADIGFVEPATVSVPLASEEASNAGATRPAPEPGPEPEATAPVAASTPVAEPLVARDVAPTVPRLEERTTALGGLLAAGARLSVERAPRYDPSYVEITYPGGDPPLDRGAAVDVVVRAFRHAGIDLQKAVHEDLVQAAEAYGIQEPDPNIDHRRIRNLVTFFQRRATSLSVAPDGDWAPGDIVFWDRNADGAAGHLGVVTAETGPSGKLLVVHHHRLEAEFAGSPSVDDVLSRWPVVGHYRWEPRIEE